VPHYVRSHGLGNDYIVMDPKDLPFTLTPERVRKLAAEHKTIVLISRARTTPA